MTIAELQTEREKILRQFAQPEEMRSGDKMLRQGDLRKRLTAIDEEIARLEHIAASTTQSPFVRFYLSEPK